MSEQDLAAAHGEDLPLARRVWRRYGGSPGVISRAIVENLVRRGSRFGGGGLAADIQQRWLPSPAGGWWSSLPLRWPADAPSGPGEPASGGGSGLARRAAPAAIQRQAAAPGAPAGQPPAPPLASGRPTDVSRGEPRRGTIAPPEASHLGRDLGPAILQRAAGGSPGPLSPSGLDTPDAARLGQAPTAPESTGPAGSVPAVQEPLPAAPSPAAGGALPVAKVQARAGTIREMGPAILRRSPASRARLSPADRTLSPAPEPAGASPAGLAGAVQPLLPTGAGPLLGPEAAPLRHVPASPALPGSVPGALPAPATAMLRGKPILGPVSAAIGPSLQRLPAMAGSTMPEELPVAPPQALSPAGRLSGTGTEAPLPGTPVLRRRSEGEPPRGSAAGAASPLPRVAAARGVTGRSRAAAAPALPLLRPVQPGALGAAGAAGQIQLQRAAAPASAPAALDSSTPGSPSASSMSSAASPPAEAQAGPDTEELVEQVLRRLSRSLAVERERRGGSR